MKAEWEHRQYGSRYGNGHKEGDEASAHYDKKEPVAAFYLVEPAV